MRPSLPPQTAFEAHYPQVKDDGSHLSEEQVSDYVESILDLNNERFWRMECPGQESPGDRYQVLRETANSDPGIKYFFALDLYESVQILPRLLSSIVQTTKYLGPENCALSIIEGRSRDGTYAVLHALAAHLTSHGIPYWLNQSSIDPHAEGVDRIAELSILRNMALRPLRDEQSRFAAHPLAFFVNDIAVCPDDLLEMLYQHLLQNATQTCAMDWVNGGELFYDVWVSRSMSGNTFFEIPQDMSWAFSRNMFWDEPVGKDKYRRQKPLQVFSCWGGMTVLDGVPFMTGDIAFRRNIPGECYGGEPQTLASDWVKLGKSRVQTLPYVAVAYNDHEGSRTKDVRGYVHKHVDTTVKIEEFEQDTETERIRWRQPPPRYRCMPGFMDAWWVDAVYVPGEE